jgi:hypothetical protein
MNHLSTDDFANRELSIEELDAIAAGWPHWLHSAVHGLEAAGHFLESNPIASPIFKGVLAAAGAVASYYGGQWLNRQPWW